MNTFSVCYSSNYFIVQILTRHQVTCSLNPTSWIDFSFFGPFSKDLLVLEFVGLQHMLLNCYKAITNKQPFCTLFSSTVLHMCIKNRVLYTLA